MGALLRGIPPPCNEKRKGKSSQKILSRETFGCLRPKVNRLNLLKTFILVPKDFVSITLKKVHHCQNWGINR